MKGEYVDHYHHHQLQTPKYDEPPPPPQQPHTSSSSTTMFSKPHVHHQPPPYHHNNHHHQQQQQQQQQLPFAQHFHLSSDSPSTDDTSDQPDLTTTTTTTTTATATNISTTDGATIEAVRRPRGRPPGSKNKPKSPVVITREPEPAMSPFILELPGGSDVVESLSRFCRRKNIGLCVLTGTGTVANVTLRQPSTSPQGSTITFHGRFDILSISAVVVPPQSSSAMCPPGIPNTFSISLAGPQGQIVGGLVAGSLIAAGTVYVIAASFSNPGFHRLGGGGGGGGPGEEGRSVSGGDEQSPVSGSGGGGGGGGGDSGGRNAPPGVESGMYGAHSFGGGSDVLWAPTARPPQQRPPPY